MTPADIRKEILDILENIAPDEDLSEIKDEVSFRDQLEMDSMDFLDIVMELRKRYRIQIPEEDYAELGLAVSSVFQSGAQVFFSYDTLLGFENLTSHLFTLGGRWEF